MGAFMFLFLIAVVAVVYYLYVNGHLACCQNNQSKIRAPADRDQKANSRDPNYQTLAQVNDNVFDNSKKKKK
ncbi:unnamed protein product, partial [Mesorhabditis spiculigera]